MALRYDGNRIVVYFQSVHFDGTLPPDAQKLPCPVASSFFCPVKLPASCIARFQKVPGAEHFALGDKYDLIIDRSETVTVTLTTLVGAETDEGVGNDSYIGALATLEKDKEWWLDNTTGYSVLRRHRKSTAGGGSGLGAEMRAVYAFLPREPVRFDIQTQIFGLLTARMRAMVTEAKRSEVENMSPAGRRTGGRSGFQPRRLDCSAA